MSQSTYVGAILVVGFILWLAAKDRLVVYENVLWGAKSAPPASGGSSSGGGTGETIKGAAEVGAGVASGNPLAVISGLGHIF